LPIVERNVSGKQWANIQMRLPGKMWRAYFTIFGDKTYAGQMVKKIRKIGNDCGLIFR
jgi:hypothetical protein